jgi:hypothetical protein
MFFSVNDHFIEKIFKVCLSDVSHECSKDEWTGLGLGTEDRKLAHGLQETSKQIQITKRRNKLSINICKNQKKIRRAKINRFWNKMKD